jgi:outer membrane protein TolC
MLAAAAVVAAALGAGPGTLERLTFQEAVDRALAHGTASLLAAEDVRRAEGLLGQARSGSLPFLGVTGTLTRHDADRVSPTGQVLADKSQQGATATLSLPLLAPGRWAQWAHAGQFLDATQAGQADVRRSAALGAARAYLTVVALRRAVEVSESARQVAGAHFDFASKRRKGGVGNALDELRAQQELASSEVQVEGALTSLLRAREALGVLTGSSGPLDADELPAPPPVEDLAAAEQAAESLRADVQAARALAHLARRVWKDGWVDWLPVVSGTFSAFLQEPPTSTTPADGWVAQLVVAFPIFEGGLRPAQAREREAVSQQADLAVEQALRQARSEVRVAFEALQRSLAAHAAARRGAESARAALDLAGQAYQAGAVTNLEVIDAERRARDAALAAVIAEDAVRQNRLDLLAAAGRFP